jgi:hypothetical protein
MNSRICKALYVLSLALVVVGLVTVGNGAASAQTTNSFSINYFSNNVAAAPDATVRIDNPGLTYGNLCTIIYVFDADQEMNECCGCVVTHDGLRTLSVKGDLTANPLTGVIPTDGVIVLGTFPPNGPAVGHTCGPTSPGSAASQPVVGWGTHTQNPVHPVVGPVVYPITETTLSVTTLGVNELANLQAQCAFINILGRGEGICTCGTGD